MSCRSPTVWLQFQMGTFRPTLLMVTEVWCRDASPRYHAHAFPLTHMVHRLPLLSYLAGSKSVLDVFFSTISSSLGRHDDYRLLRRKECLRIMCWIRWHRPYPVGRKSIYRAAELLCDTEIVARAKCRIAFCFVCAMTSVVACPSQSEWMVYLKKSST